MIKIMKQHICIICLNEHKNITKYKKGKEFYQKHIGIKIDQSYIMVCGTCNHMIESIERFINQAITSYNILMDTGNEKKSPAIQTEDTERPFNQSETKVNSEFNHNRNESEIDLLGNSDISFEENESIVNDESEKYLNESKTDSLIEVRKSNECIIESLVKDGSKNVFSKRKIKSKGKRSKESKSDSLMKHKGRKLKNVVETEFPCRNCGEIFERNLYRCVHERHHCAYRPICHCCNKLHINKMYLLRHLTGGDLLEADLLRCQRRRYSKQCEVCHKILSNSNLYRDHIKMHSASASAVELYTCSQCDQRFSWRNTLYKHIKNHRLALSGGLKCVECDRQFNTKDALDSHMKNYVKHRQNNDVERKRHVCVACGHRFQRLFELSDHVDLKHNGIVKYKCQVCDKILKNRTTYASHTKIHRVVGQGELTLCHVCGKHYKSKRHLNAHITNSHTKKSVSSTKLLTAQ